jgi:hypothetical protein
MEMAELLLPHVAAAAFMYVKVNILAQGKSSPVRCYISKW